MTLDRRLFVAASLTPFIGNTLPPDDDTHSLHGRDFSDREPFDGSKEETFSGVEDRDFHTFPEKIVETTTVFSCKRKESQLTLKLSTLEVGRNQDGDIQLSTTYGMDKTLTLGYLPINLDASLTFDSNGNTSLKGTASTGTITMPYSDLVEKVFKANVEANITADSNGLSFGAGIDIGTLGFKTDVSFSCSFKNEPINIEQLMKAYDSSPTALPPPTPLPSFTPTPYH